MDSGKTTAIMKTEEWQNPDSKILFFTARRKQATNFENKFGFFNYMNIGKAMREDPKFRFKQMNRRLLSPESMHILDEDDREFDLIFIDEASSIIRSFCNHTTGRKNSESFEVLNEVMHKAKRVIMADAFLSDGDIQFFHEMGIQFTVLVNNYREYNKIAYDYDLNKDEFLANMFRMIRDNKRVFVASASKHFLDTKVIPVLEDRHIKYRYYSALSDDHSRDFRNVNNSWNNFQVVLTTPTITVGIDHNCDHFDATFVIFASKGCTVRDTIQMPWRS